MTPPTPKWRMRFSNRVADMLEAIEAPGLAMAPFYAPVDPCETDRDGEDSPPRCHCDAPCDCDGPSDEACDDGTPHA